jgi:hypothetical protein
MVQGPITYWFDPYQIEGEFLLSHDDAENLKARVALAVADWVGKTGVSITEGTSGDVRIRVSGTSSHQIANGNRWSRSK